MYNSFIWTKKEFYDIINTNILYRNNLKKEKIIMTLGNLEVAKNNEIGTGTGQLKLTETTKTNLESDVYKRIAAIDIGGTFIKSGLISNIGEILLKRETPTEAQLGGKALMNKVITLVKELSKESDINGIGISTGGQISPKTGEVLFATEVLPGWTGMQIKKILEEEFKLPVFVDNDANAAALGEKWVGSAKDKDDFLYIIIGTGLGGAIVIDGKVYTGHSGSAGEWGHIVIDRSIKKTCTCGGSGGCFEQLASFTALTDYVAERSNDFKKIDAKEVFDLAKSGNKLCVEAVNWYIDNLGLGISNLLHIFNPSLVVLGSNLKFQGEWLLDIVKEKSMPSFTKELDIRFAQCGNDAGILGAAYGVLQETNK